MTSPKSSAFSLREHERFLQRHAEDIARFRRSREAAFSEERSAWAAADLAGTVEVAA